MTTPLLRPASAPPTPRPTSAARGPVVGQAVRFLLVGGAATVLDVGLFNVLHYGAGVGPLTAKVLSTVAGGVAAFVGNRQWSFGGAGGRLHRQVLAFVAVNVAALVLALLPLAVARYGLGLTSALALNIAGNGIGLVLATGLRFWGYRRWVFPVEAVEPAAPAVDPAALQVERRAA